MFIQLWPACILEILFEFSAWTEDGEDLLFMQVLMEWEDVAPMLPENVREYAGFTPRGISAKEEISKKPIAHLNSQGVVLLVASEFYDRHTWLGSRFKRAKSTILARYVETPDDEGSDLDVVETDKSYEVQDADTPWKAQARSKYCGKIFSSRDRPPS